MTDIYRALADATRRRILDLLADRDGMTLFEICTRLIEEGTHSSRQAVSQHLGVLEGAGLVRSGRVGRTKVHHFTPEPLREITRRWPLERQDNNP